MIISKKHWFSYVMNVILILIIAIPCIAYFISSRNSPNTNPYIDYGVLIFGIFILYKNLRAIILNLRVEWLFDDEELIVKSGLLPWHRVNFSIDISKIYEMYYKNNFMGTILGYGTLHVRQTDGVTSQTFGFSMTNHKKITVAINEAMTNYKNENKVRVSGNVSTTENISSELMRLAHMHSEGIITNEEFAALKRKLIH
ncbi:hypothetical protein SAMN04488007_2255 [Maribacter aquivivus]|uniref:PH domain-containing protein n=1 Tax=Maribacter aquivivus TaxID=228958 RepID=A0A1M6QAY6_9FLAO|nr:SHOCT domain-containing protein [Maribacter aquivivus]SHK17325.1 hypothetical protein SAMN04488007_2255 [Maribacter aquivivus]